MAIYDVAHPRLFNSRYTRPQCTHDFRNTGWVMEPTRRWGNLDESPSNVVPSEISGNPAEHPLLPSISLDNLVRQRDAALQRIDRAIELIREALVIAQAAHLGTPRIAITHLSQQPTDLTEEAAPEEARRQVDHGGWDYLMSESGLLTFMDAKAREEWRKQLESDALPPLTAENIVATFRHVHSTRSEMFERGVISLFQRLSWDYKTNLPCRFGKRLIFQHLFTLVGDSFDHSFVNQATCNELDDLTRVLYVLDGKPEPDHRDGFYRTIHSSQLEKRMGWEGEYFSLRWFRKGSGHLTFKREDLVDQMNSILARHFPNALPKPR